MNLVTPGETNTLSPPHVKFASGQSPAAYPVIDGWRLSALIGQGATADVFLARPAECHCADDDYALKVLRNPQDAAAVRRMQREVQAARAVSHPNLVPVLSAQMDQAPCYALMPRLRCATLDAVLAAARCCDVPRALWIARQVAEAIAAMHDAGWVHLDIKPANIALDRSGHCTLFDLDLALPLDGSAHGDCAAVRGTLAYVAPELFTSSRAAQVASDVYSLGVVLYEMLCGRLPFERATPAQLVEAHLRQLPPSLRTFLPALPPTLSRFVTRMLAKEPNRRPSTNGELQTELARFEIETFAMRGNESYPSER